jgi:hypothetical protein
MTSKTDSQKIWEGDLSPVERLKKAYEANPEKGLIDYAVVLYSGRKNKSLGHRLIHLRPQLLGMAEALLESPKPEDLVWLNQAEVIATHLEWISRQESGEIVEDVQTVALKLCRLVFKASLDAVGKLKDHHVWSLAGLVLARLYLFSGKVDRILAGQLLDQIAIAAPKILNCNQRVRVYAKLGYLMRHSSGQWFLGVGWGLKAVFIREKVPFNVRLKALAGLMGIDR